MRPIPSTCSQSNGRERTDIKKIWDRKVEYHVRYEECKPGAYFQGLDCLAWNWTRLTGSLLRVCLTWPQGAAGNYLAETNRYPSGKGPSCGNLGAGEQGAEGTRQDRHLLARTGV